MFVYNDAVGHVTQFQPPDWLLLRTSSIPWHRGDSQFTRFPAMQLYGGRSLVSTFFQFLSCNKGMVPVVHYASWSIRGPRAGWTAVLLI